MDKELGIIASKEERLEEAKGFTLMSDVFMSVALEDIPACQYVVRILMNRPDLVVTSVKTQYTISKITSHDARLDVLAEITAVGSDNKLVNIEIQRRNTVDHSRRTRFYGAMIDSEYLQKGAYYDELPDVYIFYISETDIWNGGKVAYEVSKTLNGQPYDDGIHTVYINAAVNDGSAIASLMQYFKSCDPKDDSQGELSKRVQLLKSDKEGEFMCELTQKWYNDGEKMGKAEIIINMMDSLKVSLESALQTAKIPDSEKPFYIALVDNIKSGRVKTE
ncbi:PD-(D/E)XK nuclease family transposase [Ruminococcus sp.]|uniref:PD-(D/E)XK nuclease family transposase n=1 Tax=Ruminococcus sp. TaxID=41978 RepID=UPI0025EB7486|nr:PD-(D/E)XK nuclease family transposase [Ruminococcus sp.]MBR1433229.1 PD-(D/E)XK nuclease family transposase [Ruminococcus sp.]